MKINNKEMGNKNTLNGSNNYNNNNTIITYVVVINFLCMYVVTSIIKIWACNFYKPQTKNKSLENISLNETKSRNNKKKEKKK